MVIESKQERAGVLVSNTLSLIWCVCMHTDLLFADADHISRRYTADTGEGAEQDQDRFVLPGTGGEASGRESACRKSQAREHPQTAQNLSE